MFKLSALNETNEDIAQVEKPAKDTKEAQEAQAFKLYNEALRLQQNDCRDEAVRVYEQLLETPLVIESATTLVNEHNEAIEHPLKDPGLILKYSAHKNVASICASQGDVNKAMENYLQAVMLDTSDVTLWYKIGIIAAQLSNLHLSRRALTQGLECNPNHWPCLDSLITVCYAILDYENCLAWISKALQKDPCFKKGIYLRRKMISECPHLRKDFDHLFQDCGTEVFEMEISDEDSKILLDEALTLRENNRKLCIPPKIPDIPLKLPLKSLTWLNLGKSLIATYEFIETQEEPISVTNRIEMRVFEKTEKHSDNAADLKTSANSSKPIDITTDIGSGPSKTTPDKETPVKETCIVLDSAATLSLPMSSSVNATNPVVNNSETSNLQDSDSLPSASDSVPQSPLLSNSQKKGIKRKKTPETKISEQGRRSERRSSRMKHRSLSRIVENETFQTPEFDFRQTLFHLLPSTLQPNQTHNMPIDLDSDTNSQDSSLLYLPADTDSLASTQGSESNMTASTSTFMVSAEIAVGDVEPVNSPGVQKVTLIDQTQKIGDCDAQNSKPLTMEPVEKLSTSTDTEMQLTAEVPVEAAIVPSSADVGVVKMDVASPENDKTGETASNILQEPIVIASPDTPVTQVKADALDTGKDVSSSTVTQDASNTSKSDTDIVSPQLKTDVMETGRDVSNSKFSTPKAKETTSKTEIASSVAENIPGEQSVDLTMSQDSTLTSPMELQSSHSNPPGISGKNETLKGSHKMPQDLILGEEARDVQNFIDEYNAKNGGILNLLQLYCKHLGRRSHLKWEDGLREVFLKAYSITQPSLMLQPFDADNLDNKNKIMHAFYILTHLECAIDEKYKKHSIDFEYYASDLEYSDMGYIIDAARHPEIFEEDPMPEYRFKNFVLRFHWVRATYFYLSGDKDSAFCELTVCSKLCFEGVEIPLQHLNHHNKIELSLIKKRLDSLKRFRNIEQVESLYAAEKYSEVIKLLESKSDTQENGSKNTAETQLLSENDTETKERPKLLKYLIKASVAVKDSEAIMKNLAFVMHEATRSLSFLEEAKLAKDSKAKHYTKIIEKWNSLLKYCCENLNKILESNVENLALLEKEALLNLTSTLISLINSSMLRTPTKSQFIVKPEIGKDILRPWFLLFKITKFEEGRRPESLPNPDNLPGSTKILVTAHDWLGEKGLCCISDGALLRFLAKDLLCQIKASKSRDGIEKSLKDSEEPDDEEGDSKSSINLKKDLESKIEQCFFCLYGYPNKISKASGLVDHFSLQITLKWDGAIELYSYFHPEVLPGFDSYKINTVLSEMAGLLSKIIKLIPEKICSNMNKAGQILEAYLAEYDPQMELKMPTVCREDDLKIMGLGDVYYLVADYYFKHKEMTQAAKHYLNDLCINPERFDSWAGLALVKSSIIDDKLRLCVTKSSAKEPSVVKLSKVALSCFEKAVNIDRGSTTLWIEYGSLAYWMHSHFSRQKRFKKHISDDEVSTLDKHISKMLDLAEDCFNYALTCDPEDVNNEEWLLQYMLGKILEKRLESPQKYLPKYSKSAGLLHRKHAKYPKKIQFRSYQSDYAIEALEMYFRLHASILKLVQHEINVLENFEDGVKRQSLTQRDYDLFDDLIEEAQEGNFVKRESLPYSQLYEKSPIEGQLKKQTASGKLTVLGSEKQSGLSMGSLVPDSIVSALSIQIASEQDSTVIDENSADAGESSVAVEMDTEPSTSITQPSDSTKVPNIDHSAIFPVVSPKLDEEVECALQAQLKPFTDDQRRERALNVKKSCVSALHLCLGRLPQHYKSLYRLADLYWRCPPNRRHVTWSRDVLLSSETPWQQVSHMPCQGLLNERNKTNLFNGVWKIPVDEIDRPGSFGCHLYRCILLLLDVLLELKDHNKLLYLRNMLSRNPDQGRKYLRDPDRIRASKIALSYSIKALHQKVMQSGSISQPGAATTQQLGANIVTASETLTHLIDAGKIYQQKQRVGTLDDSHALSEPHKELLLAAFEKYSATCPGAAALFPSIEFLPNAVKIERILKFCQQCTVMTKTATSTAQGPNMAAATGKTDLKVATGLKKSSFEAEEKQDKIAASAFIGKASTMLLESAKRAAAGLMPEDVTKKRKLSPVPETSSSENIDCGSSARNIIVSDTATAMQNRMVFTTDTTFKTQDEPIDLTTPKSSPVKSGIEEPNHPIMEKQSRPLVEAPSNSINATSGISVITSSPMASGNGYSHGRFQMPQTDFVISSSAQSSAVPEVENRTKTTVTTVETISVEDGIRSPPKVGGFVQDLSAFSTVKVSEDSKIIATALSDSTTSPKAELKTVIQGSKVYTKIIPSKPISTLSLSPRSAFTPTKSPLTLKRNPQLEKIKVQNKAPLLRSTSLPESSRPPGHRTLQRTNSISDYTKQKLKSSILMRTSASLVRKPSITEQEINQLIGADAESSQSEDEEELETTFKPLDAAKDDESSAAGSVSRNIDIPIAITPVSTPCAITADDANVISPDIT